LSQKKLIHLETGVLTQTSEHCGHQLCVC